MAFVNRSGAGRSLAEALSGYRRSHPVVLTLPRGGAPVAAEIAARLDRASGSDLVRSSARQSRRSWRWWTAPSRSSFARRM
ncbi:MAG: hypothetical protein ACLPSF_14970 [Methylocella sp.]